MFRSVEYSLYVGIVATILTRLTCSATQPYKSIGCYVEHENDRALPENLMKVSFEDPIQKCAAKAESKEYSTFAIYYWDECYSGPNANKTYAKHGISTKCRDGVGNRYAIDVYQFTDEILWPEGTFSLLKPSSGCPSDWVDNGWIFQDNADNIENNRSSVLNIDGYVTSNYVVRSFCTKTKRTSPTWPAGQYCIYKDEDKPKYMKDGWITIRNVFESGRKSALSLKYKNGFKVSTTEPYSDLLIHFFCQTSGVKSQAIDLPITHPFYLLPYGSTECQQVKWMVATTEWIQYKDLTWLDYGTTPSAKYGSRIYKGLTMFYCYYESCNKTLSDMKGTFQSPRIHDKYPDGQLCSWKIRVLANHTVHVDFTNFSLAVENGNDTDVLEYYTSTNGSLQLVEVYRGGLEPFKVHSTSDLMFVFRSNQADSSSGFNADYHIIPDQAAIHPSVQKLNGFVNVRTGAITTTTSTNRGRSKTNDLCSNSLNDNRGGTWTTILIVIPLVCFILVLVLAIDIIYRYRLISRTKSSANTSDTRTGNDYEQVVVNPTYGRSSETITMTQFNNTAAANTSIGQTERDNDDQRYEKLDRHILPKHDVPEQYDQLNRSAQPIKSGHDDRVPLQNDGPVYHTVNEPDSVPLVDDQLYHTIDKKPSSKD